MKIQATRCFNDSASELNAKDPKADQVDEAVRHFDQGQSETALKKFDAVLREAPDHLGAQIGRSFAVLEVASRSDPSEREEALNAALDSFQEITNNQPKCWQAHVGQSEALALLNQPEAALQSAHIAVDLAPKSPRAQSNYADMLVANAVLEQHTLTQDGDARGGLQAKHSGLEQAIKHYDFALDAKPHNERIMSSKTSALILKAHTQTALGNPKAASHDFDAALSLDPGNAAALRGKHQAVVAQGGVRTVDFCFGALP